MDEIAITECIDMNGYLFDLSCPEDRQLLDLILSDMLAQSKEEGEAA